MSMNGTMPNAVVRMLVLVWVLVWVLAGVLDRVLLLVMGRDPRREVALTHATLAVPVAPCRRLSVHKLGLRVVLSGRLHLMVWWWWRWVGLTLVLHLMVKVVMMVMLFMLFTL